MALVNVLAPGNNEAAGALQLIELLQLKGCVVTADALHCHRGMAKAIVERGGDYVLASLQGRVRRSRAYGVTSPARISRPLPAAESRSGGEGRTGTFP